MRTFFAIPIDARLREHYAGLIEGLKQKATSNSIRWVKPENLHLSLKFLGDIGDETCEALCEKLQKYFVTIRPFSLNFTQLLYFPSQNSARIIAVGTQLTEELGEIYNTLNNVTSELNFKKEKRPFVPHVTLGRIKDSSFLPFDDLTIENKTILVEGVTLYKSQRLPEGPIYDPLHQFYFDRRAITRTD